MTTTEQRIAILYSDGSLNVLGPWRGQPEILRAAREERDGMNVGETRPTHLAKVVEVDLTVTREIPDDEK